jgi:hypothetical protein
MLEIGLAAVWMSRSARKKVDEYFDLILLLYNVIVMVRTLLVLLPYGLV